MAFCPKCGSSDIALRRDTNINWGRAIVGWAAFGVVGGAVAGVTGEDRNAVACLDCGASWRPADIFSIIQTVKDSTGITLDLSLEKHRFFLERFISELSPYIDLEISKAKEKSNKIIMEGKAASIGPGFKNAFNFAIVSLFFTIGIGSWFRIDGFLVFVISFIVFVLCLLVGKLDDTDNNWSPEAQIKKSEKEAATVIDAAKQEIKNKIVSFSSKYFL
jgi:hypothetical protein